MSLVAWRASTAIEWRSTCGEICLSSTSGRVLLAALTALRKTYANPHRLICWPFTLTKSSGTGTSPRTASHARNTVAVSAIEREPVAVVGERKALGYVEDALELVDFRRETTSLFLLVERGRLEFQNLGVHLDVASLQEECTDLLEVAERARGLPLSLLNREPEVVGA